MLDVKPEGLMAHIRHAEEVRDAHLSSRERMVRNYHGPWWDGTVGAEGWDRMHSGAHIENYIFSWITLVVPRLVSGAPRVRMTTPRVDEYGDTAKALAASSNRWVLDTNYATVLDRAVYDYGFNWAVLFTSRETLPGYEDHDDPPMRPSVTRIDPTRFGYDPLASSLDDARFAFHVTAVDKEDLLDLARERPEEGWKADVIERLSEGREREKMKYEGKRADGPDRGQITFYVVWVPEAQPDEFPEGFVHPKEHKKPLRRHGYNGTVYYIHDETHASGSFGAGVEDDWIREPQPYFGPRWGPYSMIGTYVVPDHVAPLSSLVALTEQGEDMNAHAQAVRRASSRRKRFLLLDGENQDSHIINDATDGEAVYVAGFDRNMHAEIEVGGVTEQMLATLEVAKLRLAENLGLSEAQRGNAQTNVTATADAIADAAGSLRLGYVARKWVEGVTRNLRTVAWYLDADEQVVFPVSPDELAAAGLPAQGGAYWVGGHKGEHDSNSFDQYQLTIIPASMEKVTQAEMQQQTQLALAVATQVGQAALMNPALNVDRLLEMFEDTYGFPFRQLFDTKMLRELAMANAQAALMATMGQGGGGGGAGSEGGDGPRMSGDNKGSGAARGKSEPGLSGLANNLQGRSSGRQSSSQKVLA